MFKYFIYAADRLTGKPGKPLGWIKASSTIEAAWLAWKRWPKHGRRIRVIKAEEE